MLYVEVLAPAGLLDPDARAALARALSARALLAEDGATDPGVLDLFASMSHVVVREPECWYAGDALVTAGEHRFLVHVRAGAWAKEMAGHLVARVTEGVSGVARAYGWPGPRVAVQVTGVTEGGFGIDGRAYGSEAMIGLVDGARTREPGAAPPGTYIDPTCGAAIPVSAAVTVELDGTTYGFCCPGCRGRYVKRRRSEAGSR